MVRNIRVNPSRFHQFLFGSVVNLLLLIALLSILPQPVAHAGTHLYDPFVCYGISDERTTGNTGQNSLLKLDPASQSIAEIGLTGEGNTETIALGPNGHLYGVDDKWFGQFTTATGQFIRFEKPIGNIRIGNDSIKINDVDSLAYNPNQRDRMYAVFRRMKQPDLLFVIDISTGQVMPGALGGNDYLVLQDSHTKSPLLDIDDLLFDYGPDGTEPETLLGLANNQGEDSALVAIDLSSGKFSRIGTVKSETDAKKTIDDLEGIAFWNDGGVRKLIGSTGQNVEGNRFANALFQIHYTSGAAAGEAILATELLKFTGPAIDIEGLACVSSLAAIDIEKFTNGPGQAPADADIGLGPYIKVGDPVTWRYVVKNSGQVALQNIRVDDDKEGTVTCPQSTLQVNEAMTCTATSIAVAGDYMNMSSVVGVPIDGQPDVTDQDPSHYHARRAAIGIEKATNGPGQAPQDADRGPGPYIREGQPVNWTYVVQNSGQLDQAFGQVPEATCLLNTAS